MQPEHTVCLQDLKNGYSFFKNLTRLRVPKESNRVLVDSGIKVLIDDANSSIEAIIHRDEPQQAIFLTRDSFKIKNVYTLRKENVTGEIDRKRDLYLENILVPKFLNMLGYRLNNKFKIINTIQVDEGETEVYFEGRDELRGYLDIHYDYNENKEYKDYSTFNPVYFSGFLKEKGKEGIDFTTSSHARMNDIIKEIVYSYSLKSQVIEYV